MKIKLFVFFVLVLAGCACNKDPVITVPITLQQKPTLPQKPHLEIYNLNENSSPPEVVKSYVASIQALDGYCNALKTSQEY